MDLSFISGYFNPLVMAGCLSTGYIVKKWIKDVDNKYIPTLVFIEGALLNIILYGTTLESIIGGTICGLASTGLHQAFKQIIENGDDKNV